MTRSLTLLAARRLGLATLLAAAALVATGSIVAPQPSTAADVRAVSVITPAPVLNPLPAGRQIWAIGDSVLLGASPYLKRAFPGISIDAVVSRQASAGPAILRAKAKRGQLRPVVIIALGTNGTVQRSDLNKMVAAAGPDALIVLVNVQAPRRWVTGVNATLAAYAAAHRNVALANWHAAIRPHLGYLYGDRIHVRSAKAGSIYAAAIQAALQRLVDLPPLAETR